MTTAKRLLILGTGSMAHRHAEEFGALGGIEIVAAADIDRERARRFAEVHAIPRAFGSLDEALAWNGFDAAVNATPDAAHHATTLQLVGAGKSVFCEKPLAVNHHDALEMTEVAEAAGVVNMVNLTYRNAHALQHARHMVASGRIGAVRHVEASYLQSWLTGRHWGDWRTDERWLWRLSTAHGSKGVVGDIGIHLLDFLEFGTGLGIAAVQARLQTFPKSEGDAIGAYRLDANDSAVLSVELENGALASVHMSRFATGNLNDLDLRIFGTAGALHVWANERASRLEACLGADVETATWRAVDAPATLRNTLRFAEALRAGRSGQPDFRHAATVQRILDLCFVSDRERRMLPVAPIAAPTVDPGDRESAA